MRRTDEITVPIPGAAMEWAIEESRDVLRRNHWLTFDQLAAVLVIRGIIVAATDPALRDALAKIVAPAAP